VFECASGDAAATLANFAGSRTGARKGKTAPLRVTGPKTMRLPKLGEIRVHCQVRARLHSERPSSMGLAQSRVGGPLWTRGITALAARAVTVPNVKLVALPHTRQGCVRALVNCGAILTVGAAAAFAAFAVSPVPAHVAPGPADPIRFSATADPTYRADGWHTTTVSTVTGRFPQVSRALASLASLPLTTPAPGAAQARAGSDATAWGVAQSFMGLPVGAVGTPVQLATTWPGVLTSDAGFRDGDILLSIGGVPTRGSDDLVNAAVQRSLGRTVTGVPAVFVRAGKQHTVPVTFPALGPVASFTSGGRGDVPAFPALLPLPNGAGGPSGGLLTALAYLDASTPGDLTGGRTIAGTGTISLFGQVGDIAGARFKIVGARDAGADVFFAPVGSNAREAAQASARNHLGVPVVPVATLQQALDWLCAHGGASSVCTHPAGPGA